MLKHYTARFIRNVKIASIALLALGIGQALQAQQRIAFEDFENGLGSAWTVNSSFSIQTSQAFNGSQSAGDFDQGSPYISADYAPNSLKGGVRVDSIGFYWYETSSNNGFRFRFLDNSGNTVLSVGGNNPQWTIDLDGDGSCFQFFGGDGYNRWVKTRITFDWQAGTYTYFYEDLQSGTTRSGTRALNSATNIEKIEIRGENNEGPGYNCLGQSDNIVYDDIAAWNTYQNPPSASFSVPDTVYLGDALCIESTAKKAASLGWQVDGAQAATGRNLDFTPSRPLGKKTITHVATNPVGSDTATQTTVLAKRQKPNTQFIADRNIIDPLDNVQLTDLTTGGPTSWQWSFPNTLPNNVFFPSVNSGSTPVTLTVNARGDLGSNFDDGYDVIDENGNTLATGVLGSNDCAASFDANVTINLTLAQLRNYLSDGKIGITLDADRSVDALCNQNDGYPEDDVALLSQFSVTYPTGDGCLRTFTSESNQDYCTSDGCQFDLSIDNLPQPSTKTPFNNDTAQDPTAKFLFPGSYDVCLETSNGQGADTLCKKDFIIVREEIDICDRNESNAFYGLLTDDGGTSGEYGNSRSCSYTITPCASNLFLQLEAFDLEQGDFLRIYDGTDTTGTPLWDVQKYGSQGLSAGLSQQDLNKARNATTGSAYIEFETDATDNADGFELGWSSDKDSFARPNPGFTVADTVCPGVAFTVNDTSVGKNLSYTWEFGTNGIVRNEKAPSYTFPNNGIKDIQLTVQGCGGTDSVTQQVVVRNNSGQPSGSLMASDTILLQSAPASFTSSASRCASYYKWEFNGSSAVFQNGTTANDPNPEVAFLDVGTVDVTLNIGNQNDTIAITRQDYIKVKCAPGVTRLNSDIGISRVQLGNLDNSSPVGQAGYNDYFNNQSALVELFDTQTLTISRNTSSNAQNVKVWVDLDQDKDFQDQGELLFAFDSSSRQVFTDTFVITDPQAIGNIRMRIGANIGSLSNTACGPNRVGEYEDYKLRIRRDQTPPTINLIGNDTLTLPACQALSALDTGAIAIDNLQGRLGRATSTNNIDTTAGGLYEITYAATDSSGNRGTRKQFVRILPENQPPQITLNGPDTIVNGVNTTYADPGFSGVTDACSGVDTVQAVNPVNSSVLGTYVVRYTAIDSEGNRNTVSRTVEVADTTKPAVQLAGNNPAVVSLGDTYNEQGISSLSDNFYDSTDLDVNVSGSVNVNKLDTFILTYEVSDPSGNTRVIDREVQVLDQEAPSVSTSLLPGDTLQGNIEVPINTAIGIAGRVSIADNAGADKVTIEREGNYFNQTNADNEVTSLGTFNAQYIFVDVGGNETVLNLDVTVTDDIAPDITLKGSKSINLKRFAVTPLAKTFDSGATATDNHALMVEKVDTNSTYFTDYANDDSTAFSPGLYEVVYVAIDSAGNTTRKARVVNVKQEVTGVIGTNGSDLGFEAYPNPTKGLTTVALTLDQKVQGHLELVNNLGQTVRTVHDGMLSQQNFTLDLSNQSGGIYFLRLETKQGTAVKKIVVQ
jgi:PKD repeat protein